ncbi:hypothetical protein [Streptomyces sp. NPDC048710]
MSLPTGIAEAGYDLDGRLWLPPTNETIPVADCEHTPRNCAWCFDGGPI